MSGIMLMDWGTTNFRALFLDGAGSIKGSHECDQGVGKLNRDQMVAVASEARSHCPWDAPVIYACGMVGSSVGWQNVPYVASPASLQSLAGAIETVAMGELTVNLVPGVKYHGAYGWDVMRGEELQAFGWASQQPNGLCIAPGTHSKWMHLHEGEVRDFFTSITGEMFALLKQHGLLRHHLTETVGASAHFFAGLDAGMAERGLGRLLFSVRGNALLAGLNNQDASDYVSGLLIGAEMAEGLRVMPPADVVGITGAPALALLYQAALKHLGYRAQVMDAHQAVCKAIVSLDSIVQELVAI